MDRNTCWGVAGALVLALALAGCRDGATDGSTPATPAQPATTGPASGQVPAQDGATGPVRLEDVMEANARYIMGISYPPGMDRYPGLAAELKRYADAAHAELMEAVEAAGADGGEQRVPYDLTLAYEVLMETPRIVAVQAFGTLYTGGAHGNPLVARFVWLPQREEMLRAEALVTGEDGWREISAFVREALRTALSQRLDAVDPADRARLMGSGIRMIDDGTAPVADNFGQFEPVPGEGGRLRALRFVFPPYQVGPYSDGMQAVEVPADVLVPHVAPEYRELFATG